jgi:hypothetical protein
MTAVTQLAHHGMIFVPPGYSMGGPQFDMSEVKVCAPSVYPSSRCRP